jgi:molybdopterin synthase catalytic subunit
MPDALIVLSSDAIEAAMPVFADGEGAECQFLGTVRGEEDGRPISGIEYTAYRPMADRELGLLCERAHGEHGPHRVEICHRLGFVPACEPSIVIRVKTRHSAQSFDLCRWYLKEIKTSVPIWKRPVFVGT